MKNLTPAAAILLATTTFVNAQTTWENVDAYIQDEVDRGFSGSVLLVHDGQIVLDKGFGFADRERQTPSTPETIYALGSTPIDFTHVAILQLLDQEKLDLDDPISKYFDDFDAEHASITIDMLRTGRSGLPDFPNIPEIDADPDHSPLSRDEFIKRTANAQLLFRPGSREEHSHFAWGVLAAIVEVVSGQTYPDYIREHVLTPAGMSRTGFHGDKFPNDTVAIGYDARTWGDVNAPDHWNPTTWLIMGSGGMLGTTHDLYRFNQAIEQHNLIPKRVRHLYPSVGVYMNGNMYGFETAYNFGGDDLFYVNCNSSDIFGGYTIENLARQLEELCDDRPVPHYSIGIGFGLDEDGQLFAAQVLPGRPADQAGLKEGDALLSANGKRFDPNDPLDALRDSIETGTTLRLKIRRDGKTMTIIIHPTPIDD